MSDTPPAPTLTVDTDANPCPRIEVLITPMPTDAATVTVWRNYAGTRSIVRGASNTPVSGDHLVIDYEAPLQTPVTYTVQTADPSGTPSQLSDPSLQVTVDEPRAWLQDPLDPSTSMPIGLVRQAPSGALAFGLGVYGTDTFGSGSGVVSEAVLRRASFAQVTRSADITLSSVFGSDLPLAGSSVRRDASAVPIEIRTTDATATETMRTLLTQAAFPLLRTGGRAPMLRALTYLALPDITEAFIPGPDITVWTMTGQSVRGPGASVLIPTRTYNDLLDEASSYDELLPLYATYIDLLRGT